MKSSRKGFTMIELLVVLLIIGILAAVAAPMYLVHTEKAKVSEAVGAMSLMRQAEREYYTKHNAFRDVTSPNIEADPEIATNYGLGVSIGPSQYFGKTSYSVDITSPAFADGVSTAKDFVITAAGSATNTADTNVRNGSDVATFKVEMDNSGLIRYTTDGTTWKTY